MTQRLRIGDFAARCGVTRDTIRFYERSGLLDKPGRTASHHRVYDDGAVSRVRLVRQMQICGLTIGDIQEVMKLRDEEPASASKKLMNLFRVRLGFLEARITDLETCREQLTLLMQRIASARTRGYAALNELPPAEGAPPFRFGRRAGSPQGGG